MRDEKSIRNSNVVRLGVRGAGTGCKAREGRGNRPRQRCEIGDGISPCGGV